MSVKLEITALCDRRDYLMPTGLSDHKQFR